MPQVWNGWQAAVLADIPAPDTAANVKFLTDWHGYELSGAQYNPLNTTQRERGSTTFNTAGVQNYTGPTQGALATAQTLTNGFYGNIVAALKEGDPYVYAFRAAVGQEITTWGTPNFAALYLGKTSPSSPGTVFTPSPVDKSKGSPRGWLDANRALAIHLPTNLHKSDQLVNAAQRELAKIGRGR